MLNFQAFASAQQRWSANTFGPSSRFEGIMKHIRSELSEIETSPTDATEYADVIILITDLAWRQGITPYQLTRALQEKQLVNFGRVWNVAGDDEPCEHIEPRLPDASQLRMAALKALCFLNKMQQPKFVVDVTGHPMLDKSKDWAGGAFRVLDPEVPGSGESILSGEALLILALMHGYGSGNELPAHLRAFEISPEVEDLIQLRCSS